MTTLFTRARGLVLSVIGFFGSLDYRRNVQARRSMNG
jgi:hypothetical protein